MSMTNAHKNHQGKQYNYPLKQKSTLTPEKSPAKTPAKPAAAPATKAPVKDEAPDAAKYTLGGKSPFLTSVTVEKRPLSGSTPEVPVKNVYPDQPLESALTLSPKEPTKIIKKKQKSSGGLSFVIILLTIILGAAVGVVAYYLLPK